MLSDKRAGECSTRIFGPFVLPGRVARLSAIAVLIGHLGQIFIVNASPAWTALGTGSVMIFFVISGFFIRKSLEKGGDFLSARVNRIAPPFAFAILLTIGLWFVAPFFFVTGNRSFAVPTALPGYAVTNVIPTMLLVSWCVGGTIPANEPLWSLAYEVFYYLLVALRNARIALAALIAASAMNPRVGLLGAVWFAGFWIAKLHTEDRLPRLAQWPFVLPALLAAPVLMLGVTGSSIVLWQLCAGTAFAGHLVWILNRVPANPGPIARSACWSYTLYLIHYPLLLFAYGMGLPMLPSACGILLFAALIGPKLERIRIVGFPALRPNAPAA